ncbi:alkaline phosphatase D family protein [Bacteroidota bacterium]
MEGKLKIVIKIIVLIFLLFFTNCEEDKFKSDSDYGQFAPADAYQDDPDFAYYGSENEWNQRMFSDKATDRFYKRRGQRQMLEIIKRNNDEVIKRCFRRLKNDDEDLESLFNLTIAYSRKGVPDSALLYFYESLEKGLPFERYLSGPRELLQSLYQTEDFQFLQSEKAVKLIHGPMLGSFMENSIRIWLRTIEESDILIKVYEKEKSNSIFSIYKAKSNRDRDYTAVININNLKPGSKYFYDIEIDNFKVNPNRYSFTTPAIKNDISKFKIAFGGGAGYTPDHEKIWDIIINQNIDALLLLGDNVYIDLPEIPGAFHNYTYYRRQSRAEFRRLVAAVPVYTIWDDHDSGTDDVWMGPYLTKPEWKLPLLEHYTQNWVNPAYGTPEVPGCFYNFSLGHVDFFMLDGRFYRTNPYKVGERSMLGSEQKEWLFEQLIKSEAVFKILVSPVPWHFKAKPGSHDTWAGFPEEREEIFSFIEKNRIEGVVLLAADRHRSDAWKIERKNGYDFYELMSSRLTNIHTHELMPEAIFGYNEKCSFGVIEFDFSGDDPGLLYKIISIDGEQMGSLEIKNSMLTYD